MLFEFCFHSVFGERTPKKSFWSHPGPPKAFILGAFGPLISIEITPTWKNRHFFAKNWDFSNFWDPFGEAFGPPNGIKIDEKSVLKNASFSDTVFYRNSMLFESNFELHFDIFWCVFHGVSKKADPYETLAMRSKIKVQPSKKSSQCEPKSIKTALRKRIPKKQRKNAFWESF